MWRNLILLLAILQPPAALIAYATQATDARDATLTIGVFGEGTTVTIALPAGWDGPSTVQLEGPAIVQVPLRARTDAPPGLGTIVVRALGQERRAWVRTPGEVAPAQRPSRLWLALIRR